MSSIHTTPDAYRDDIARSKEALAQVLRRMALVPPGVPIAGRELVRRAGLLRQLAALEEGLARAEQEWAAAQARGAGQRVEQGR